MCMRMHTDTLTCCRQVFRGHLNEVHEVAVKVFRGVSMASINQKVLDEIAIMTGLPPWESAWHCYSRSESLIQHEFEISQRT